MTHQEATFRSICYKLDIASWSQSCFLLTRNQLVDSSSLP